MQAIFIVMGVTGIFEQRTHWAVEAWQCEDKARAGDGAERVGGAAQPAADPAELA